MADGVRLGGAYYELTAESAPLIAAMAKAEQQSKRSAQAIAQATGLTEQAVRRLAQTYVSEQKRAADASAAATLRIIKAHNDAAAAAERAAQKSAAANQQAATSFLNVAKGAGAFAAGAAGIAGAAATINAAMSAVAESTRRAEQAQFSINKLYGSSAGIVTQQAEALARTSGKSRTEALEAAAAVATLGRQYALTAQQQQQVLQISANLAAVRGISMADASERVASALRGEAEAAEYLGQTLNSDAVKAFANMTEEQRKNFETLSPITKAQIVLGKLVGDNADLMTAAAERTQTASGAFDKLTGSIDNLSASIGQRFSPATAGALTVLTGFVDKADAFVRSPFVDRLAQAASLMAAIGSLNPSNIATALVRPSSDQRIQVGPDEGLPGSGTGPTADQLQAAADNRARARQQAEAERDALRVYAQQRKREIDAIADAEERAARRAADAEDKRIERVKIALEVERAARLKALERRERDTIKAIEAEAAASKKASEEEIERLEIEKDARLAAAEAAKDAAEQAIEARSRELDISREVEDRQREDERRNEDRALEDARRAEDRARDDALAREIERIEQRRDANLAAIEAEIDAVEEAARKRQRNLEAQEQSARRASDRAIQRIEDQADAEDERHRKLMQALDDERDARLEALDVQLRALDAAERAEGSARRTADLQRRLAAAQQAATLARGTGTPEQIAEARGELTRALRGGNEISIANARERLAKLAGQGAEAIRKADEELAEAQQELRDQGVDDARDAERQKLRDAQQAIRDDIDARKRAADEANRLRRAEVEDEKRAERDKLQARLDKIARQKQAAQDAARNEVALLRNTLDAERQGAEEAIRRVRDQFNAETEVLNARRREQDRFRQDERLAQDRLRADERRAEDDALRVQREAVQKAFEQERADTEAHYNGPTGVITIVRKAQEAAAQAYRDRIEASRELFAAEKEQINSVYRNPEKTGLLDLQDKAAENNKTKLGEQLTAIEDWKNRANGYIEENAGKWKTLKDAVDDVDRAIRGLPGGRVLPPGGVGPIAPPGYGGQPDDGGGAGQDEPAAVQPVPGSGLGDASDEVDVSPERFNVAFGFNQPYTNPFNPAIPNHRGVDLVIAGARNGGRGLPVGAFRSGTVVAATIDPNGGNGIIIQTPDGLYNRYFHFDELNVSPGQGVKRGQRIGVLGASGTEGFPHLHFEVSRGINGDPMDSLIDPRPYMRDSGYLFREPTMTVGLRSGARNLIAERRPELLVSGAATARLINRAPLVGGIPTRDYAALGDQFARMAAPAAASGDSNTWNISGVGMGEVVSAIRRHQHRRELLRGVRNGG